MWQLSYLLEEHLQPVLPIFDEVALTVADDLLLRQRRHVAARPPAYQGLTHQVELAVSSGGLEVAWVMQSVPLLSRPEMR